MKYTIVALQPGEDWKREALLVMYKKIEQTQFLSQFSKFDADDSLNGFLFHHMPCLLYIIMWEAIFLPDIFSVNVFCVGWWYVEFHIHKGGNVCLMITGRGSSG